MKTGLSEKILAFRRSICYHIKAVFSAILRKEVLHLWQSVSSATRTCLSALRFRILTDAPTAHGSPM